MRSQKRPKSRSTNGALPQSSSPSLRFPSVVGGKEPIVDDDPFRVHDRFEYLRSDDGWSRRRLQP
jgi:hypothetical protein